MSEDSIRQSRGAFIYGMIQGWASSLSDPDQVKRVIIDMLKFSKELAKGAGVIFSDDNGTK